MTSLPIDALLPALCAALASRHEAVLEAPPGAGKTTRVPLAVLEQRWLAGQTIIMLEPRRLAARAAAERLASELGERVGETVGYRIRLDSKVGPRTRIEVVTEGILTRRLQDDPALEGVGLVIFDEFHERSLDADLALALCLNGRAMLRGEDSGELPLKVLLMSATLEGERLAGLLDDAPVLRSEGRMFPVDIRWGAPFQPGDWLEPRVVQTVLQALDDEPGSLLVFLPGQAEIRRVAEQLTTALEGRTDILLCPLHGELELSAQRAAIEPAPPGLRKVVLATNIAETSLTIDGVRVVVDAGLARVPRFDPNSAMTRLDTQRISRASATQRAGRAGRLQPGACYRLWSQAQHEQLAAYGAAEILQADLTGLALQLVRWGVQPAELVWLDPPPAAAYAQAMELLARLGAVDAQGVLTRHGQAMAELPTHPRIAHLLLRGQELGLGALASDLAALLGERDILRGAGADLHSRLALLAGAWPAFLLFASGEVPLMILGGLLLAIGQGFYLGPLSASMAALLPHKVRVTGLSFGYSLAVGLFGGLAPMFTEFLIARFQLTMAPAIVIMLGALVSLVTLCLHPLWRHHHDAFVPQNVKGGQGGWQSDGHGFLLRNR